MFSDPDEVFSAVNASRVLLNVTAKIHDMQDPEKCHKSLGTRIFAMAESPSFSTCGVLFSMSTLQGLHPNGLSMGKQNFVRLFGV